MKGIIYKYTFADGKVYIGQTRRHPEKRKKEHFNPSVGPANSGFWEAYKRLGMPKYEVLYEADCKNVDELVNLLNAKESLYINFYRANNPLYGYNKTSYGSVGTGSQKILEKKFNEKFQELKKEKLRLYNSATDKIWHTFLPLTKEEKYLIKDRYKHENLWQKDLDKYNLGRLHPYPKYENDPWFEEALDYIYYQLEDEAYYDAWAYIKNNAEAIIKEANKDKIILQLDNEGNIIKEFYSTTEICHEFDIPRADNVLNVLKGRQKSAYGYFWNYKKDTVNDKTNN